MEQGKNAYIFFLIQREDADSFSPAAHIDPLYASTLAEALKRGVQALAYQAGVSPQAIIVRRALPIIL